MPLINHLCLRQYLICRSNKFIKNNLYNSVSIIIPCKNEFGNIKSGLRRIDNFCKNMEIIFVEGNSSDNTWNEIKSVINDDEFKKNSLLKLSNRIVRVKRTLFLQVLIKLKMRF